MPTLLLLLTPEVFAWQPPVQTGTTKLASREFYRKSRVVGMPTCRCMWRITRLWHIYIYTYMCVCVCVWGGGWVGGCVCVRVCIDGLVQDCIISSALAMERLQSCTKPSILFCVLKREVNSRNLVNVVHIWIEAILLTKIKHNPHDFLC